MIGAVARKKDPTAAPPYLSLFHLREPPFAPRSGPAFFYADPEREQFLNMLLHLTQYSEELLLVTGVPGVGKTALLEKYLSRADDHWQICRIEGATGATADNLFLRIAECFHLDLGKLAPDRILEAFSSHLSQLHQQMTPVLVIDDAHLLSGDALEIALRLATLEGEHGRLIRVTLFAEPALALRLGESRFQSIPAPHRLDLKPFDEEQTGTYLNHRLRAAGYSGSTPFTPRHVKRIFKASQGFPARINLEAHQVLTELAGREGRKSPAGYLKAAAALGTLAAAGYLFHEPLMERLTTAGAAPEAAGAAPPAMVAPPTKSGGQPIVRTLQEPPSGGARYQMTLKRGDTLLVSCEAPLTEEPAAEPSAPPAPAEPEAVKAPITVPEPPTATEPRIAAVEPNPLVGRDEPQVVTVRGEGLTPVGNVAVSSKEGARVLSPDQVQVVDEKTLRLSLETGVAPDSWALQVTRRDGERSNVVRFQVIAPPQPTTVAAEPAPAVPAAPGSPPTAESGSVEEEESVAKAPESTPVQVAQASAAPASVGVAATDPSAPEPSPQTAPSEPETPTAAASEARAVEPEKAEAPVPSPPPAAKKPSPPQKAVPESREPVAPARPTLAPAPRRPLVEKRTAAAHELQGGDWIRSRPDDHFTIQLAAFAERESLSSYIRRHGLTGSLAVYRTERNGRPLLVLVQGDYPNRSAAERAVAELPQALRRAKPWVRPFGSLAPLPEDPQSSGIEGLAWIWSRNPGHWTVQIAAASTADRVREAAAGGALSPVAILPSTRGGKPWYELLYGDFPDRATAVAAMNRLPASLRSAGPWPRRFADIHADLSRTTRP